MKPSGAPEVGDLVRYPRYEGGVRTLALVHKERGIWVLIQCLDHPIAASPDASGETWVPRGLCEVVKPVSSA